MMTNSILQMSNDFTIVLLCNAYSTNPDFFARPMAALSETINKPAGVPQPTVPLSMVTLDSLTVHAKMSLIHSIVGNILKQVPNNNTTAPNTHNLAPALVETYARLLVYTEIESLGIKGFLSKSMMNNNCSNTTMPFNAYLSCLVQQVKFYLRYLNRKLGRYYTHY